MRNIWLQKTTRILTFLLVGVGCGDPTTGPEHPNLAEQLWDVRIERRSMTMATVAPYDTLTLRVLAFNGLGDTIPDGLQVSYHSLTDTTVRISSDGVLTVRSPTDPEGIKIVAHATYNGITRTDTALVVVTTDPASTESLDTLIVTSVDKTSGNPRLPQWSISPGFDENPVLVTTAYGEEGTVLTIPWDYVSSNPSVATINPRTGELTPRFEGVTTITVSTTWYGTTFRSSFDVMVIGALAGSIVITERIPRGSTTPILVFTPGTLRLETGAVVSWENQSSQNVEIQFEDPTKVQRIPQLYLDFFDLICRIAGRGCNVGKTGGNISLRTLEPEGDPTGNGDMRYFPIPGTYTYRTSSGITGTIIIQ